MIGDPYAKLGVAGALIVALWGVGVGIDRLGGRRVVSQGAREGALSPEVPLELPPLPKGEEPKHTALVALSVPQVKTIDPGTIQVATPGLSLDGAQIHPIYEFRQEKNPKPRAVLVLMDNSKSMVINSMQGPASDPDYKRLDACRVLLESLPPVDRVALACFPCRRSVEDQVYKMRTDKPFELLAAPTTAAKVEDRLNVLRDEENGSTPLYRAVQEGAELLAHAAPDRKRVLVLLTDGRDTDGDEGALDKAAAAVKAKGIDMYAVGLGGDADMGVLGTMAPHTLRADDATALNRAFRQILLSMSRTIVQVDVDVMVARHGRPIPPGQKVDVTFRSGGKLYHTEGRTQ